MTMLTEQSRAFGEEPSCDTQPFEFTGLDTWGQAVRGRLDAVDRATAEVVLRARGISAASVSAGASQPEPYRVSLAVVPSTQLSVAELVRRAVVARRARRA